MQVDTHLIEAMKEVRYICSVAHKQRTVSLRQPLASITIHLEMFPYLASSPDRDELEYVIKDECNVKEIKYAKMAM